MATLHALRLLLALLAPVDDRTPLPGETDCAYEWRMAKARSEDSNPAEFVNVECGGLYR